MEKVLQLPDLEKILKTHFESESLYLKSFDFVKGGISVQVFPVRNREMSKTVHGFLLEFGKLHCNPSSPSERDRPNFNRLIRFFSEGKFGRMTLLELLNANPARIENEQGIGPKSISHLQLLLELKYNVKFLRQFPFMKKF